MLETIWELLKVLSVPLLRGSLGWLENAIEDSYISDFEWRQLGVTVIRISTLTGFAYFGINAFFDVSVFSTAAGIAAVDFILSKIKSTKKT